MPNGSKNTFCYSAKRLAQPSSTSSPTVGSLLYRRAALNMTFGTFNSTAEFYSYPYVVGLIYRKRNNYYI